MQKNLFTKYFSICASLILICVLTLGGMFMASSSNYFSEERFHALETGLEKIVRITEENYETNGYKFAETSVIKSSYDLAAEISKADVILADNDGKILFFSSNSSRLNYNTYKVPNEIIDKLKTDGIYKSVGTMGKIYSERYYIVGMPIKGSGGETVSGVFISNPARDLTEFLNNLFKMVTLSGLFVIFIAFVAIYFVTKNMVKPLRNMLEATKAFGKGDFSVRVDSQSPDEIGQLGASFNNMAQSLASMETVRRSFVANVSHELKTPMQTIGGFVDGILDGTIPREKQQKYLEIISSEVKRLARVVNSMLNIAKIEAGEMSINPVVFDINDVVLQTMFTFEQALEAKHVEVRGLDTGKIMVEADKDLIHQVVYNLTENAVKFVDDGGYIEVIYNAQKDRTYIGIKNSGMGIPKEEIPRVFDRFYKTDKSRGLDKKGVGLGLYIVRSIVHLHKGEIIVRSAEGEYCEFMFSIPSKKS